MAPTGLAGDGVARHVAAAADRADGSALALLSGDDNTLCLANRTTDGAGFGETTRGTVTYPAVSPQVLTYVSAIEAADGSPSILVGRVPPATSVVRLVLRDGSDHAAVLGDGVWLAWPPTAATPTRIEALDASGDVISRLADPGGVQPAGLSLHDG